MSYPHSALSITSSNPLRRSSGLIFVVALHLAVIAAISVGTNVKSSISTTPPIHVLPTIDVVKPQPLPTQPFTPKEISKTIFQAPELPPTAVEKATEHALTETPAIQGGDTRHNESVAVVINARVDPSRPLTQPAYPTMARRNGEQGRVELMLHILPNGRVSEATIAQTSGYSRLDESAIREALKSWRFIPQQENGVAVATWQRFAITFRLDN